MCDTMVCEGVEDTPQNREKGDRIMAQVTQLVCDMCGRVLAPKGGMYAVRFIDEEGNQHSVDACAPMCLRKSSVIAGRDFGAKSATAFVAYALRVDDYDREAIDDEAKDYLTRG